MMGRCDVSDLPLAWGTIERSAGESRRYRGRDSQTRDERDYCAYIFILCVRVPDHAMESAINTVVSVYLKSSKGKESLGDKDFQNMVKKQLGNIMTGTDSSSAVKEMRAGLDENDDGKVSFPEYMTLIGYLANTLSEQKTAANNVPAS
ncbi:hypothetical protein DPEC_G00142160 [Dallia pectoralis]|uniref:Uncharacterized protein n=1 Tax=Dallia pectoralis TaxID=75939 RepID=A0ACC2GNJ1_DALPE|nr:hypothetical protein DPEC_G00142160 [Dallia pectoralis]